MTLSTEWAGQTSEDHRATVLLRQEHETLLAMFRRQRAPANSTHDTRDALQDAIAATLDMILCMERDVFFPALPTHYGALLRACAASREGLANRMALMRHHLPGVARQNAQGERLELLAREHLAVEQALLFDSLEREHPDLNHALYDRLVNARRSFCNALPI